MTIREFELPDSVRDKVRREISKRVSSNTLEVPVLPHVAQQVISLSSDMDASAKDFERVIRMDNQLAGRLLRIANSPVYGQRDKITSLQRAIVTVGIRTLKDLAFAIAMGEQVFRSQLLSKTMQKVWEHSVATGYAAHRIAEVLGMDRQFAFLCGLLHDCGKPILIQTVERVLRVNKDWGAYGVILADDIMSEYHGEVGGLIARSWKFSDLMYGAIRHHHQIDESGAAMPMAHLTAVANLFAHALGFGSYSHEDDVDLMQEPLVFQLNLSQNDVKVLRDALPERIHTLIDQFRG